MLHAKYILLKEKIKANNNSLQKNHKWLDKNLLSEHWECKTDKMVDEENKTDNESYTKIVKT